MAKIALRIWCVSDDKLNNNVYISNSLWAICSSYISLILEYFSNHKVN